MYGTDGILALLQDIKALLYGIARLILAGILLIAGVILIPAMGLLGLLGIVLVLAGICLGITGILYVRHGHTHHEVIEHPNEPAPQGGSPKSDL